MPEEHSSVVNVLQTHRNTDDQKKKRKKKKKRRKKKRKKSASITHPQDTGSSSAEEELSAQNRESLRWEGALEDPHAEETRLDLYRANRRQRYIDLRQALLREIQETQTDSS